MHEKFLAMKIKYLLFTALMVLFFAAGLYAQTEKVSIKLSNVSIKEVLSEIERQSSYRFFYNDQLSDVDKRVSIDRNDVQIKVLLNDLLTNTGIGFTVLDNNLIIITPNRSTSSPTTNSPSPITPEPNTDILIEGKVSDLKTGETLIGVNVQIEGTDLGTITDFDGNFSIEVADREAVLLFSYLGYDDQAIKVGEQTFIEVKLSGQTQLLDEIIVVGYGTQKKSNLTGVVASIKTKELQKIATRRLDDALQGKAPGVYVANGSGAPGAAPSIFIRGISSFSDASPLYIIDGVPSDPGNQFNINDIENIEILQDASAAAIYGARAANGVILITTKRGKASEKLNIDFSATFGKNQPTQIIELLNRNDFLTYSRQARENAGISIDENDPFYGSTQPDTLPDTDWISELYNGSGLEQAYNLSISGGSQLSNYFISFGYQNEQGVMILNDFENFTLRANSDFKIGKRIKIGESFLLARSNERPTLQKPNWPIRSVPVMEVYDASNPYGGWGRGPEFFSGPNHVAVRHQNPLHRTTNLADISVYGELEILKGLKFKSVFGYRIRDLADREFNERFDYGKFRSDQNFLTHIDRYTERIIATQLLTYNQSIGKHDFTIIGGYEFNEIKGQNLGFRERGFVTEPSWSFGKRKEDATENLLSGDNIHLYRMISQFGRVTYAFDQKYLLTFNARRDGSSRFGPENRFGVFPSLSVGWRVDRENFFKDKFPAVDMLKIRYGYGKLGSDRLPAYIYTKSYRDNNSFYAFDDTADDVGTGRYISRFVNEAVRWEEVTQSNIGLDLGLFEGKISMTFDYYIKETENLLLNRDMPQSMGLSQSNGGQGRLTLNLGTMANRGWDFLTTYRDAIGPLKFDMTLILSHFRNEVIDIGDAELKAGNFAGTNFAITENGQPMSQFRGYLVNGVIQNQAQLDSLNENSPNGRWFYKRQTSVGDLLYLDIASIDENGNIIMVPDGKVDANDLTYIGDPWPELTYSYNLNLSYKIFDLSINFTGEHNKDIFNAFKARAQSFSTDGNTTPAIKNAWTPENPTNQPRNILGDPNGNYTTVSSYFVEDGSFLRLRTLQLGCTLPKSFIPKLNLEQLRVFVNLQNYFTWTQYSGMDPEVGGGQGAFGIDDGGYPRTKTILVGLNASF